VQLKLFKTLWGFDGSYVDAIAHAIKQGYDGIEGPVPETIEQAEQFSDLLSQNELHYIAEVATTGTYVPDRKLSVEEHLHYLKERLECLKILKPDFITCLGGCDAWSESDSVKFLTLAMDEVERNNMQISFETHRGRIFFNPWVTERVVKKIPEIKLTCDFSHWSVVCEGLQETEEDIIKSLLPSAWHIHGRVGYDQGPQVPDPRSSVYQHDLQRHQKWWEWIWLAQHENAQQITTLTSEFGPDGYEYRDLLEGRPLVDLDEINQWVGNEVRTQFRKLDIH
jgi:hypothetical protein